MPNSIDILKEKRESGYGSSMSPPDQGGDRSISLKPEEMQAFQGKDGPVTCQVTGTLQGGKLMVDSISVPGGGGPDGSMREPMPVMPPSQISPG